MIDNKEPSIYNIKDYNNSQKNKKKKKEVKKKKKEKNYGYTWLINSLKSKDPYFSVDHGVQLLSCLFKQLEDEGVSRQKISELVNSV